jgi:hypothetical protein
MKLNIDQSLYAGTCATVDFPHRWSSVKEWWVKWDTLHYVLKNGEQHEIELGSITDDVVDWKRPIGVQIRDGKGNIVAADED